ncbi:MAG: helix-turn-helix domain-containing protein [Streptomycetales bacterium]
MLEDIGDRIVRLRRLRGLTQSELARRADVSLSLIRKLEQHTRHTLRIATMAQLAAALDVSLTDLLGKETRLARVEDGGLMVLRRALTTRLEPVLDEEPTSGEAAADAGNAWRLYWSGSYSRLASVLADAIPAARAAPGAHAALAELYECAACLLVHLGREDLSFLATEKALAASARGDDELFHAAQHGSLSWVHLEAAHYGDAAHAAASMATRIEPRLGSAEPRHVSVWGSLLLSAATAEARLGRRAAAEDYLNLADAAAVRLGEERDDLQTHFGRSSVIMQWVNTEIVFGNHARALRIEQGGRRHILTTPRRALRPAPARCGSRAGVRLPLPGCGGDVAAGGTSGTGVDTPSDPGGGGGAGTAAPPAAAPAAATRSPARGWHVTRRVSVPL